MDKEGNIIIKDPLYKQILLKTEHKNVIDSPFFQRLRNIKQTSFVDFVYPNANHTRFSHSLGTYHLMRKVLANNLIEIDLETSNNLLLSALLHDIGHGPFSHTWEKVFPHFNHEEVGKEIILKMGFKEVSEIIDKKNQFSPLISSTIDMDKLDYMARDSYFSGVSYGVAEVDFIIQHIYIREGKLVIKPSALSSVEDLITQRVNLFKTVYYHKIAILYDFLFKSIFMRVSTLVKEGSYDFWICDDLLAFFEERNDINNLLNLDDNIILAHINEWRKSKDSILADLCHAFKGRRKFSIVNLAYSDIDIDEISKMVSEKGYNLDYYFAKIDLPIKIIQDGLFVDLPKGIVPIEDASELISFYKKQDWKVSYLIYPNL